MENEYATWEAAGEPCETMDVSYSSDRVPSDVLHILDLFRLLTNVTKAQIHLPVSLTKDVGLQISKQDTEDVMMKVRSLDDGHKKLVVKTLEEAIAKSEENLKYGTGSFSQDKLNELCGYGHWIFKPHLDIFEYIWPHRDCIYKWEYRSPFRYIGDEDLIGAPLDYVDPYDSDDYYS